MARYMCKDRIPATGDFVTENLFWSKNMMGIAGELHARLRFTHSNFMTYVPEGEKGETDVIIENEYGVLFKIQVKFANVTKDPEGVWTLRLSNKNGAYQKVDYIYVVCNDCSEFLIDVRKIKRTNMIIRDDLGMQSYRKNQYEPNKYDDYVFHNVIGDLQKCQSK